MDWWKRKKTWRANEKKQRLIRGRETGALLLEDLIESCDGKSNPIKIFSADQIIKATDNVCECNIPQRSRNICECTTVFKLLEYGGWYSGKLDNHRMILLVEKLCLSRHYPSKVYDPVVRDITISSMVSGHKNFMKLVGCCLETEIPVMVYYGEKKQYTPLDLKTVVSWRKRMKIAEDIATALAYLHTAFSRPFIYCNMIHWNILLDEDGVAKLSNFYNCISIPEGETFVKVGPLLRGVSLYMDHDYLTNGIVSEKTDAFGFGILMQKLLTGKERYPQVYDWNSRWLSESIGEGIFDEIVDPKMLEKMGQVSVEERCRMEVFAALSERCIGIREEVPKMVQVAKEIKKILRTASSSPSSETQIDLSSVLLPNQI